MFRTSIKEIDKEIYKLRFFGMSYKLVCKGLNPYVSTLAWSFFLICTFLKALHSQLGKVSIVLGLEFLRYMILRLLRNKSKLGRFVIALF